MTDVSRDQEAIDAALGLAGALDGMRDELKGMRKELAAMNTYGHRNRRLIFGLAVSFALDIVLTIVVAVFAIQAHNASGQASIAARQAAQNHISSLASCRTGNINRAAQVTLWTHLVAITPQPPAVAAALMTYVRKTFAPRDCVKIYPGR